MQQNLQSSESQFVPDAAENVSTGIGGILIYLIIFIISVVGILKGIRSKTSRRFFYTVAILALCELPRYFAMVVTRSYTSQPSYALHLISNSLFFISFSIVCYQWSGLLKLGVYFKVFYGIRGLMFSNLAFAIVDVAALTCCLMSTSLESFFNSMFYEALTFIEAIRNVIYSSFLMYYGLRLVMRFWHYTNLQSAFVSGGTFDNSVFSQAVIRLTAILLLTTICFALRVCMLAAKMAALHSDMQITSASFGLFGFWWFFFSDFLVKPSLPQP